jgi:flavin-dependent dehydrogenase
VDHCDVLIVGGGPGGSSCAWGLRESGLDVVILDRQRFPRDKVCAGWITPQVCDALDIDLAEYRKERVMQPIRGFAVERLGDPQVAIDCGEVVSYGIRRREFDHFLLGRSGARLRLGEPLLELRRDGGHWVVNGEIRARWLIGAGGHFCPVARHLGARPGAAEPTTVVAREIEFEMTPEQQARCRARPELPEIVFTSDLEGYGWVIRKGDWLNVGLGRQDARGLPAQAAAFLSWLTDEGRIPPGLPRPLKGHAYLLYDDAPRPLGGEGVLLVGDAAGFAYGRSGEGIRPAVESALLAARALRHAAGHSPEAAARSYQRSVIARFGRRQRRRRRGPSDLMPKRWRGRAAGRLLATPWFARNVVIRRWFLHRDVPPLGC